MDQPTYTIEPYAKTGFLRLTLTGHWNVDIATRFAADVDTTLRQMLEQGVKHGELLTLIDMRRKHILPQNVAAEFAKMVRPGSPSRRIAMLVSGALHRLQAQRLSDARRKSFDDEAEALAWLADEQPLVTGAEIGGSVRVA